MVINLLRKKKKNTIPLKTPLKKSNPSLLRSSSKDSVRVNQIDIDSIAKKVEHETALIRIGKNGVSENIIIELKKLIPLKKAVKIKILQNAPIDSPKEFFEELELQIGFKLWRTKGNTGIYIYKRI